MYYNAFSNLLMDMRFRITAILICLIIVSIIFSFSLPRTKSTDVIPVVNQITKKELQEFEPVAAEVYTGISIRDFTTFDIIKKQFVIDAIVWFEFDPEEISLERVNNFTFIQGDILQKIGPDIKLIEDDIFAMYHVKVAFQNDLRFHYFPFESHQICITLTNVYATLNEIIYKTTPSGFNIFPTASRSSWNIDSLSTYYGYTTSILDTQYKGRDTSFPEAIFVVNVSPIGIKNILVIFLPMLFALLISLFSLVIPYKWKHENRYLRQLSNAALTSLLAYRFILQTIIPEVGYSTTADSVYTLCLLVTFIPFFLEVISFIILHKSGNLSEQDGALLADKLSLISMYTFLILAIPSMIALAWLLII